MLAPSNATSGRKFITPTIKFKAKIQNMLSTKYLLAHIAGV
jgi:hypothetical protein